ncbi:DUF5953 family protein [Archangium violaceum]|uniref:DUF5953 family protein n=1 Tax=Archangium violaceum TaxID=83451 RepID=UPI0037C16F86
MLPQAVPLSQRDAWVAKGRRDGPGIPLVCNGGDASSRVTISGWERPASRLKGSLEACSRRPPAAGRGGSPSGVSCRR